MRILVLSDTHIPKVAADLPQEVYEEAKSADMIIHAGDFIEKGLLEKLGSIKPVKAVSGNMDLPNVCAFLNPKEIIEIGRFKIGLIHGYGAPRDIVNTVKGEFDKVDVIIFGHSHAAMNEMKDGTLFFNPGSPTDTIFAKYKSYGILEVSDKKIEGKIVKL